MYASLLIIAVLALAACDVPMFTTRSMVPDSLRVVDSAVLGTWQVLNDDGADTVVVEQVESLTYRLQWIQKDRNRYSMSMVAGRLDTFRLLGLEPSGHSFRDETGALTTSLLPVHTAYVYTFRGDTLIASFPKNDTWLPWLRQSGLQYLAGDGLITNAPAESLWVGLRTLSHRPDSGWAQSRFVRVH
jgi:hypothetical protein